jgi:hypothetical protein
VLSYIFAWRSSARARRQRRHIHGKTAFANLGSEKAIYAASTAWRLSFASINAAALTVGMSVQERLCGIASLFSFMGRLWRGGGLARVLFWNA